MATARNVYLLFRLGVITVDRGQVCETCRSVICKFMSLLGIIELDGVLNSSTVLSKHHVLRRLVSPTSTRT
jgi:hypothetical protein